MASGFLASQPVPGSHLIERNEIAVNARKRQAKSVIARRRPLDLVPSACFLAHPYESRAKNRLITPAKLYSLFTPFFQFCNYVPGSQLVKRSEIAVSERKRRAKTGVVGSPSLILVCFRSFLKPLVFLRPLPIN